MKLKVRFYKTSSGSEPVRDWLNVLGKPYKTVIGFDYEMILLHAIIKKSERTHISLEIS